MIKIRHMSNDDIKDVSFVHSEAFNRQLASRKWITCNFNAYPRIMMFVAVDEMNKIVGYIQWLQKSGFRKETVVELEQIAVLPAFQGKKIGTELINCSLKFIKEYLVTQNSILKSIMVTTRTDNLAQKLYKKTLGVEIVATIKNLYSADEVVMVTKYT